MKRNCILSSIIIWCFLSIQWIGAQEVIFVESTYVQRAMQEYREQYQNNPDVAGYRIQYLFTTDRREMESKQRKFNEFFNYIPHEWEHDQPYYRLYAGSFVNRSDAMRLLLQIRKNFPEAIIINANVPVENVLECRKKLNEYKGR